MANNYGPLYMPKLVRNIYGANTTDRSTLSLPMLSSAALYMGQFVPFATGAIATPSGAEFGIPTIADDDHIFGFIVGFHRFGVTGGLLPIQDDSSRAGTVTDATSSLPMKYTAASTNDEASAGSAKLEQVEIMPITRGDILEVTLWGGSTAAVVRGTTTAAGTTTSSANIGVSMSVNTTYPWALTESTAAKTMADLDFITIDVDGSKPLSPYRDYVLCTRSWATLGAPN